MVDLIEQCNVLYQKLEADWNVTTDNWNDIVHDSFQKSCVQHLKDSIVAYLQGSYGSISVRGKGLVDLLKFIDESARRLSALTGEPFVAGNTESQGNDYVQLGEGLLRGDGSMKDKFRDRREEEILTNESNDITYKRQHPNSLKTILDL